MNKLLAPFAVTAAVAAPASAAEIQMQVSGPVIELSVSESVKAKPDIAEISAGVTTQAPTAVEAMRQNAREMMSVVNRIKALGVDADDIQTTGVNLNARYDYDRASQKQVFRGYTASNRVSVTLRDVTEVGPVLDALVAAGATDLGGPNFSIDDETTAKAQARKAALDRVQAQAQEYAGWAGYSGVRLLEISESLSQSRPVPIMRAAANDVMVEQSTPIEPGLVGTAVTINVKYEMTR